MAGGESDLPFRAGEFVTDEFARAPTDDETFLVRRVLHTSAPKSPDAV